MRHRFATFCMLSLFLSVSSVACKKKPDPTLVDNNGNNGGENNGTNGGTNNGANNGANNGGNNDPDRPTILVDPNKDYSGTPPVFTPSGGVEVFVTDLLTETCKRAFDCLDNGSVLLWLKFLGARTEGECVASLLNETHPALVQIAVDEGRSTFDISSVGACLLEMGQTSCDNFADVAQQPLGFLDTCHDVLIGPEDAAECEGTWECGPGNYCARIVADSCLGQCLPNDGLYPLCAEGACALGEFCDGATGNCVGRGGADEPCQHSGECVGTTDCGYSDEAGEDVCQKIQRVEVESYCGGKYLCDVELGCDRGVCIELPGPGETCQPYSCPQGYYCAGDCVEKKSSGSCTDGLECLTGDCHMGTCRPPTSSCREL